MKKVRYLLNWFDTNGGGASVLKYEAGRDYELSDESERHVLQGHAVYVEVADVAAATEAEPATGELQTPAGSEASFAEAPALAGPEAPPVETPAPAA